MPHIIATFFQLSPAFWMSLAGLAVLVIGLVAAKNEIAQARGLNRIVALTHVCFAVPLAVFGAEHFALGNSMIGLVPSYGPDCCSGSSHFHASVWRNASFACSRQDHHRLGEIRCR